MTHRRPPSFRASVQQRRLAHYRVLDAMLDVLDAHDGAGRALRRVTLSPEGAPAAALPLRPPPPSGWPAFGMGGQPMKPLPGWSVPAPPEKDTPVAVVALFGLDAAGLRLAVDQVARQQGQSTAFLPIFFTDCADHAEFRRRGYLVEYFPPEIGDDAAGLGQFRDRFSLLWHKWGARRLIDLSVAGRLEPRIRGLAVLDYRSERGERDHEWERPVAALPPMPSPDIAALRAEQAGRGLGEEPDTFVLYRIIGNDLHPRHETGQSLRNVQFILDHEPPLFACEKRWVVNRIVDRQAEAAILDLLDRAGQDYLHLPFDWQSYAAQDWDFSGFEDPAFWLAPAFEDLSPRMRLRIEARLRRHKINYVVNNNGARNAALTDGRSRAKWVLPWDGNCFLSEGAWESLVADVTSRSYLKYFYVPMARLTDNASVLTTDLRMEAKEEPQILFRRDAEESFDEAFPYGRRPKVSLFWRLGIPGSWDIARDDIWDLPRPERVTRGTEFGKAGWVARLTSGRAELEASTKVSQSGRELARNAAIVATLDDLDGAVLARHWEPSRLTAYDHPALDALAAAPGRSLAARWRTALIEAAEAALLRGPFSVVDKTTLPPSGDPRDYWHPAPYWWPNPATLDGLPYVRRDGERVPGSDLYSPESDRYDRTRLQRLFDDTTVSALAWRVSGEPRFAEHAARLLRRWFLDPQARMNPHLRYAQWRPDQDAGAVHGFGLIEMKDLYFFLDAVRLITSAGTLRDDEAAAFRDWLRAYLDWLFDSPQGVAERSARNNHGTCHDLQVAAIAAYLGDLSLLSRTLRAAKARILTQFSAEGRQAEELERTQTAHYTVFNLQCWASLARLAATVGCDLWRYTGPKGESLGAAFNWLLPLLAEEEWPFPQSKPFDRARRIPLMAAATDAFGLEFPDGGADDAWHPRSWVPTYFPHDGIKPFWLFDHLHGCAAAALAGSAPGRRNPAGRRARRTGS